MYLIDTNVLSELGIKDIMIASVALCNGLTVVSANTKHFSHVPGLTVENWFQ